MAELVETQGPKQVTNVPPGDGVEELSVLKEL